MTSRRRSLRFLSVLASASLVVAACSSDDDDDAAEDAATEASEAVDEAVTEASEAVDEAVTEASEAVDEATDETTEDTATEETTEGTATDETTEGTTGETDGTAAGGEGAGGEVGGSACGTPHGPYEDSGEEPAGEVRIAWNDPLLSFNSNTIRGNTTANNNPLYLMDQGGFSYYDENLELINNDQFGTCTLDSLDPLTITYTINEGVTWSDGTPVDAVDLLLHWAAQSDRVQRRRHRRDRQRRSRRRPTPKATRSWSGPTARR